jgi:metal-responsive CopG/Arc/MetJ family transcriptional regulator
MTKSRTARKAPSKKVTISLPDDLFAEMERMRRTDKLDRSSWLQQAVSNTLDQRRRVAAIEAYIESYRNEPEEDLSPETLEKLAAAAWAELDE